MKARGCLFLSVALFVTAAGIRADQSAFPFFNLKETQKDKSERFVFYSGRSGNNDIYVINAGHLISAEKSREFNNLVYNIIGDK